MSTDLKFRLPPVGIPSPRPISRRSPSAGEEDRRLEPSGAAIPAESGPEPAEGESEACRTPKSEEHKIPELSSPPPAPRKKRRPPVCKRKLMPDFIEFVNGDDVDEFLRSGFDFVSRLAKRSKFVIT